MPDQDRTRDTQDRRAKDLALQIASQLPTDRDQSLAVLDHVRWLLDNYITDRAEPERRRNDLRII